MAEQKKGFFYRMVVGKDKDDNYARSTLPTNRWQLFWDIFKGRLGKLCIINLLMLIFFIPLIAVFAFRWIGISGLGQTLPFMGNFGMGYPNNLDVNMQYIMQYNQINNMFFLLMIPAALIAAVGISGGFYIMRNMVWTEGTFISNDFWRGIKLNIKHLLLVTFIVAVVIYLSVLNFGMIRVLEYTGKISFWTVAAQVATWIMLVLICMMCMYMITLTVTYKLKFFQLVKNSFILTVGLLFQNAFFIVLGAAPLLVGLLLSLLIPSTFIISILLMVYLLIGISIFVLCWTNFSQWTFDRFINDRVEGAIKNRGIYEKVKDGEEIERRKKAAIAKFQNPKKKARAIKPVNDEEVQLTNLETGGFTRANLARLAEEKEKLKQDADRYNEDFINKTGDFAPIEDLPEMNENEDDDTAYEGYEDAMLLEGYEGETDGDAESGEENPDKE